MTPLANVSANTYIRNTLVFVECYTEIILDLKLSNWSRQFATNMFEKAFWIFVVRYTLFVYKSSFPNNTRKVI